MVIFNSFSLKNNYLHIISFLCITCLGILIGLLLSTYNFLFAVAIASIPIGLIILLFLIEYPHIIILIVAFFYISNIQFSFGPLSLNIVLVCLCFLSIFLTKIKFKFVIGKKFFFFLCLYIGYALISYYFSHKNIEFYDINLYVNHVIFLTLMFLFNDEIKVEHFLFVIICTSLLTLSMGIVQLAQLNSIPETGITGLFKNHVAFGKVSSFGIIACYYFFKKYRKKIFILIALLLFFGLLISLARGPLFSLIAGIFILFFIKWIIKFQNRKVILVTSGLSALLLIISIYGYLISKGTFGSELGKETSGRSVFYKAAWEIYKENTFFGIGWDKFPHEWSKHVRIVNYDPGKPYYARLYHAHSSYLKILAELGSLGFILYFLFNYYLFKDTWKILISNEWDVFLYFLLFYYLFGIFDNDSFGNDRSYYFFAGILYSLKSLNEKNSLQLENK